MVNGKRRQFFNRRRRFVKRRRGNPRGIRRVASMARRAYSLARKTRSFIETKYIDALDTAGMTNLTTTMSIRLLNGMGTGTTHASRIGNKVTITSIALDLYIEYDPTSVSTAAYNKVRVAIVLSRHPQGVAPTSTDLWEYPTVQTMSFRNPDTKKDYKIMRKWDFNISDPLTVGNGISTKRIQKYLKMKVPVQYDGAASDITAIEQNAIFLCAWSDAALLGPQLTYSWKTRYVDA